MSSTTLDIFSNIASQDYLSLFHDDEPAYQKVVKLLEFQKEDVAKATEVPLNCIRYDKKMPSAVQERIREWANLLNLVGEHFQGEVPKTILWFTTPNPFLGNVTPRDMIRFGRYKKLFKFVVNAVSENKR